MGQQSIAYYRVSTTRQGQSGLGLEAQQAAVEAYARRNGYTIAAAYKEIETGTSKRERPKMRQAIEDCRQRGAKLLIAKLDRLARNVAFTAALMDSGVDFVAVDMPDANTLTIHIMAALAEYEAKQISQRTKAALQAAKARGVKLGNPDNLTDAARERSIESRVAAAKAAYSDMYSYIALLREQRDESGEPMSYQRIAKQLNHEGKATRTGAAFKPMTVYRILQRGNGE